MSPAWFTTPIAVIALAGLSLVGASPSVLVECSDEQLVQHTILLTYGPALGAGPLVLPNCTPSSSYLSAAAVQPFVPALQAVGVVVPSQFKQHLSQGRQEVAQPIHFAHLRVVESNNEWCPAPCNSPSWERAAPKSDQGSPYLLLEVAIWRQTRLVTLYHFDGDWEERLRSSFHEMCPDGGWGGCPAYATFREENALLTVGPWPEKADQDKKALSSFLRDAFVQIFAKFHDVAGSAAYTGLTYAGHGSAADGSLFDGSIDSADTVSLLSKVVKSNGKFSLLNFGGNCAEGRWNMLATLHPFADWIVASDLNVGGVGTSKLGQEAQMSIVKAQQKLNDVVVLKRVMVDKATVHDAIAKVIDARLELWEGPMSEPIKMQHVRQSIAAFDTTKVAPFQAALRNAYLSLPEDQRKPFRKHVWKAECDVLRSAEFLDTFMQNATTAFLSRRTSGKIWKSLLRGRDSGKLVTLFRGLRPMFASTQGVFDWQIVTYGLGFNFFRGKSPPCDLLSALGNDVPPPLGGWDGSEEPRKSVQESYDEIKHLRSR